MEIKWIKIHIFQTQEFLANVESLTSAHGLMPRPTSQVTVNIHDCPDSCSEDSGWVK